MTDSFHPAEGHAEPPKERTTKIWVVVGGVVILALIAAGATFAVLRPWQSTQTPLSTNVPHSPAETTQPTEPETPAPPAEVVIPDCQALNPAAYALAEKAVAEYPTIEEWGDIGTDRFELQFGPAAQAALAASDKARGCAYPFHLESGLWIYAAELTGGARSTFLTALQADGDFAESTSGAATQFVWKQPLQDGHWEAVFTVHLFIGDVWVAMYGPTEPNQFAPESVAAIVRANPQPAG